MRGEPDVRPARWADLTGDVRAALGKRLDGLYGCDGDEEAFDALAVDKQQALLLFVSRLSCLKLWRAVLRVENVYGTGGVGMNFTARPSLMRALRLRRDFTGLFASHRDSRGGFRERRRASAALHFLYSDGEGGRRWSVHFDLHNPLASPSGAWRHLFYEEFSGVTPDWRAVRAAFGNELSS
ncbi:MAG: hypothetical protein ACRD68_03315 [Pyrinomonadaceae bacterium]